jgi:hypothetical protein
VNLQGLDIWNLLVFEGLSQYLERVLGTFLEMLNFAQWLFLQSSIEGFWV